MKLSLCVHAISTLGLALLVGSHAPTAWAQEAPAQEAPAQKVQSLTIPNVILYSQGAPDQLVVIITRMTPLKTVLESLARGKGRVLYDERLQEFMCGRIKLTGTQEQIINQLVEPYKAFIAWGKAGDALLFVPTSTWAKELSSRNITPDLPSLNPQRGFAFGRKPDYQPDVPPGTRSFEFNGDRVYHVPMPLLPSADKAKAETSGPNSKAQSPTRTLAIPMGVGQAPATIQAPATTQAPATIQAPAETPPKTTAPASPQGIVTGHAKGYAWGSVESRTDRPGLFSVTIWEGHNAQEVLGDIARLDGGEAVFGDRVAKIELPPFTLMGTPDQILQTLTTHFCPTMVMGQTQKSRLFLPSYISLSIYDEHASEHFTFGPTY